MEKEKASDRGMERKEKVARATGQKMVTGGSTMKTAPRGTVKTIGIGVKSIMSKRTGPVPQDNRLGMSMTPVPLLPHPGSPTISGRALTRLATSIKEVMDSRAGGLRTVPEERTKVVRASAKAKASRKENVPTVALAGTTLPIARYHQVASLEKAPVSPTVR